MSQIFQYECWEFLTELIISCFSTFHWSYFIFKFIILVNVLNIQLWQEVGMLQVHLL